MKTINIQSWLAAHFAAILTLCILLFCQSTHAAALDRSLSYNEARKSFQTELIYNNYRPDGEAAEPPPALYQKIYYPAADGKLVAYLSPKPRDDKKHPILIWARGGHGGIGNWLWAQDEELYNAMQRGLLVMTPSWRQDNANPGKFSLFFGEVDDALAAIDYVKTLDYVDPERIYMAGHSTGGTMTLLTAIASDDIRAAFSFGGVPDMIEHTANGDYGREPYDYRNKDESYIRSAIKYTHDLKAPTFYFEGTSMVSYNKMAKNMEAIAQQAGAPFSAFPIARSDHSKHIIPVMDLVVDKILQDTGTEVSITFTQEEVQHAFDKTHPPVGGETLRQMQEMAGQGDTATQYRLAKLYFDEEQLADESKGIDWLAQAAKLGHIKAAYDLAWRYDKGNGVEEDNKRACELYEQAATAKHIWGQYFTARCYDYGLGPEQDYVKARYWYQQSAEQGDEDAMRELAELFRKGQGGKTDTKAAFKWYQSAVEAGNDSALNDVAFAYQKGQGIDRNPEKAFEYYTNAADTGNQFAYFNLGKAYDIGTLLPFLKKDPEKAIFWYEKAANKEHFSAMSKTADLYYEGKDIPQNLEKALHWYQKAAPYNAFASYFAAYMLHHGEGTPPSPERAAYWVGELAQTYNNESQYYLALAYNEGIGVKKDKEKAISILELLAKDGYQPAIDDLPEIKKTNNTTLTSKPLFFLCVFVIAPLLSAGISLYLLKGVLALKRGGLTWLIATIHFFVAAPTIALFFIKFVNPFATWLVLTLPAIFYIYDTTIPKPFYRKVFGYFVLVLSTSIIFILIAGLLYLIFY